MNSNATGSVVEPVGALGRADFANDARAGRELADSLDLKLGGATHASLLVVVPPPRSVGPYDVIGLYGQFSNGLKNGFYADDLNRLVEKIGSEKAGVPLSPGELTSEVLNVQAKIGVSEAFSKIASGFSSALKTLVNPQG